MSPEPPLVELPLSRAIRKLAWPAIASLMLVNLFNLVDAFWVGRLGTAALGGMTTSAFLVWALHAVGQLVGTGVNAVVARRVGEGRPEHAGVAGAHGLLLSLGLALGVMLWAIPLRSALLGLFGLEGPVLEAAAGYLDPILYGFPTITAWYAVEAVFRGSGDTRTPLAILGVTLLLNALLDPLFMFGLGPLPGLGIAGAAWATVLCHGLGVVLGLRVLQRGALRLRLAQPPRRIELALLGTLVRVGTPIALTSLLFSLIYVGLARIIAEHGSPALAAVGIGHRVEGLAYFTCMGFAAAASTLVGQHMGSGRPAQAGRAAWLSTGYAAAVVVVLSLGYLAFAPLIYRLFSADPSVIDQGSSYLRIVALCEVGMAFELVLEGAFSGAGNSLPPMLVCVPLTALRLPLARVLERWLGARGIWWAISASTGIKGVVMALWFRLNRWQRGKV